MTEEGYLPRYVSIVELPETVNLEPLHTEPHYYQSLENPVNVQWNKSSDPILFAFEMAKNIPIDHTLEPKYVFRKTLANDQGEFLIDDAILTSIGEPLYSDGRVNVYRKRKGLHDSRLRGEAFGYSWRRSRTFKFVE